MSVLGRRSSSASTVLVQLGANDVVEVGVGGGSAQHRRLGRTLYKLDVLVYVLEGLSNINGVRGSLQQCVSVSNGEQCEPKPHTFGCCNKDSFLRCPRPWPLFETDLVCCGSEETKLYQPSSYIFARGSADGACARNV